MQSKNASALSISWVLAVNNILGVHSVIQLLMKNGMGMLP